MQYVNRTITLVVAVATLTSNVLSSLLFHQLPDDPYHLASNFSWYLHFANVLSVFGFIGALRVCRVLSSLTIKLFLSKRLT
jgi:Co/Zn/Cd efflux system component